MQTPKSSLRIMYKSPTGNIKSWGATQGSCAHSLR